MNDDNDNKRFNENWKRLQTLKLWLDIAVRPSKEDCDPRDWDILGSHEDEDGEDNLPWLRRRCQEARDTLNTHLPVVEGDYEEYLVPRSSMITGAGLGLFFDSFSSSKKEDAVIDEDTTICYYTGHIHDFHSSQQLNNLDYLMLVQGDILVDPGPLLHVKARYINDPLNDETVNCRFVPKQFWSAVVSTRRILSGEELFVSYGEAYWSQQLAPGKAYNPTTLSGR